MSRVYIAGPMRGYPQFNFPAFDAAAALGRSLGWDVISPADMDRSAGVKEKENDTPEFHPSQIRVFMRRDVHVLVEVLKAEEGDAIALLPGWTKSTGARAELALAQWGKLKVLNAETFLPLRAGVEGFEGRHHLPCRDGTCEMIDNSALEKSMVRLAQAIANGK